MGDERFQKFKNDMNKLRVEKGSTAPFNFTGLKAKNGSTALLGKFNVPDDHLDRFYFEFAKLINNFQKHLLFTEVQGKCSPMLGDFDMKFEAPEDQDPNLLRHRYSTDFVDRVVKEYYVALGLYIDTKDVVCYVHERVRPYIKEGKHLKDGFHLFFEGVRCEPPLKHAVRNFVIDKCRDLLEDLGCVNSVEDIIDDAVLGRNNWFMLGSGKHEAQPYEVTRSYNNCLEVQPFEMSMAVKERARTIRQFSVQGDVENVAWLPGAKEKLAAFQPTKVKQLKGARVPRNLSNSIVRAPTDSAFASKNGDPDLVVLEKVVDGLSAPRADKHEDWANVAWGIFNVCYENNYKADYLTVARDLVHQFSQKFTSKYHEGLVDNAIASMEYRADGIKFGSLVRYLEEDNKTLHKELFKAKAGKKGTKKTVLDKRTSETPATAETKTTTVLSDENAKKLAYEMMTANENIPRQVNMEGVSLENIEKCHNGWNCSLPKNRWINNTEISGRGGGIDLLLGQLGLQLVNVQSDPHNPWPKDGWMVDSEKLRQVLSHVTFNNCVFNIDNSTNSTVVNSLNEERTILPCDFDNDGLQLFLEQPQVRRKFLLSLNGLHNAVAKYFYSIYQDRFRCIGSKWFEFTSHIWEAQDESDIITAVLSSEEYLEPFVYALEFYSRTNSRASDVESKKKRIDSLLRNLQTKPFKSHVLGECEETFRYNHRDFARSIDRAYLTPFSNGVLDLTTMEFRDGRPDDNMTKSMNVDYIPYDPEAPTKIHNEILTWFEQVQPDENLRNYIKKLSGLLLTPDTNLQKVFVFSGIGANGKSFFLNNVLQPAMGSFFKSGQTTLLTRKREKANESNESLVHLIGARVAVFMEPDGGETIQADILKLISGGDEMLVRANYSKQMAFKPTFKTFIVCNNKPKLSEDTFAIWRRIRVVDWPVTFMDNPHADRPYESKLDPLMEEKVKRWPSFFAGLMVHWLKQYRNEGLSEPESVTRHTKQYEEEHDDWVEFRDMYLRRQGEGCGWSDLLAKFNTWYKRRFNTDFTFKSNSEKEKVRKYFVKHLRVPCQNSRMGGKPIMGFKGWAIVDPPDESGFIDDV